MASDNKGTVKITEAEKAIIDQLLDFMVKNSIDCDAHSHARSEGKLFWYEGKWITKQQLLEQFFECNRRV